MINITKKITSRPYWQANSEVNFSLLLRRIFSICFIILGLYQSVYSQNEPVFFVKGGKMTDVIKDGPSWREKEDVVQGQGKRSLLYAGKFIEEGDFTLKIRLSLEEINKSTALLLFFNNHFGFDSNFDDNGEANKLFMYSPVTDQVTYFGKSTDFFTAGEPFDFEVQHRSSQMHFSINQKEVAVVPDSLLKQPLAGVVGLRPWRNKIHIYEWSFEGQYSDFPDNDYIFERGNDGYNCFRIPAIVQSKKGTLLAFAEGRQRSCLDNGDVDIVLKRSEDGGKTWLGLQVVRGDSINTCSYAAPIVEKETGKIIIISVWNRGEDHFTKIYDGTSIDTRRIFQQESTDDGLSWSEPKDITTSVKKENWTYYGLGYTSLIQLEHGPHKGRLILSAYHGKDLKDTAYVHLIYSDDLGANWHIGGICPTSGINETEIVELPNGTIYLLIRNDKIYHRFRRVAYSKDGGMSISESKLDDELDGFICQTSLLPLPQSDGSQWLLQTSPGNDYAREQLLLRLSKDEGENWEVLSELYRGHAAYSDLIQLENGQIGCLFECGKVFQNDGIVLKWIEAVD